MTNKIQLLEENITKPRYKIRAIICKLSNLIKQIPFAFIPSYIRFNVIWINSICSLDTPNAVLW